MIFFKKNLRRLVLLATVCCLSVLNSFSQVNTGLVFPSANNNFLGGAGTIAPNSEVSVELYTGTLKVNIPVCNLTSKDLSLPISLVYTGGKGIKQQEYASSAGLGWQLNAGGSISRVVRTYPDEQPRGYLGTNRWGQKVVAWANGTIGVPSEIIAAVPTADGEPDIFYVKTPYFSFQFSFDENGNAVVPNNTGVKIISKNFFNTTNYSNSSFEVIDDAGTHYYFGSTPLSVENTGTTIYGSSYYFPSTWYLDKIVTYNDKDEINLSYQAGPYTETNYHYIGTFTWNVFGKTRYDTTHPITTSIYPPKYVSVITSKNGRIDLSYAFDRQDGTGAGRLTSIAVKPLSGNAISTYNFNYTYFGSPSTDPNRLRLKLDNITVTGNTTATATPLTLREFTYQTPERMGSRRTLSEADYWGYLNFIFPMSYAAFPDNIRIARFGATNVGILTAIKEVTGGSWDLQFEPNDIYNTKTSANEIVGGLRVNKISQTFPGGKTLSTEYTYKDANNNSTGRTFNEDYGIIGFPSGDLIQIHSESPSQVNDINGNFSAYSSVKVKNQNGGYTVSTFSNFNDFPDILKFINRTDGLTIPSVTSSISFAYKRGLLLSQTVYDAAGNKITEDLTPLSSYTSLTNPAVRSALALKATTISLSVPDDASFETYQSSYYTNIENYRLSKTIHRDYDQQNPARYVETTTGYIYSPANLRLVKTKITTDSKGNSYTQSFFHPGDADIPMVTSAEQAAVTGLANDNNTSPVIHQTDNRNGTVYQVHNSYNNITAGIATRRYPVSTDFYTNTTLIRQRFFRYDGTTSNVVSTRLTGSKPTSYFYGYNSSVPVSTVFNAEDSYAVSTVINRVSGNIDLSVTNAATFTSTATGDIIITMQGSPGETYSIAYTLSGAASRNGTLCAARTAPFTCSYPETITLTGLPAGTYSLSLQIASGNPLTKGASFSYPISTLVSTITKGSFYEGFEEHPSRSTGSAHSGTSFYNGTSGSAYAVNFPLPDSRSYIIQWWKWTGGKWILNQQPYTGSFSIPGAIDDIRIFPSDGFMTTATYKLQVGKSSETDAAGRTTFYEYDGLNRLSLTRDNDKNITSRICNTYTGQTPGCPAGTIYTNVAVNKTATRNNCGTTFTGGSVTYTVPAGKYTSALSQSDANQQAQIEANLNAQDYANANGTCTPIFKSAPKTGSFTRNNCAAGLVGSTVTYTVPAERYTSTISQADADQKAVNDVNTNGQSYANTNGTCINPNIQRSGTLTLPPNTVTFTSTVVGDIRLVMQGSPGETYGLTYNLNGPTSRNGSLCASRTSTTACQFPESVTFTAMPAGTYTLSINMGSGSPSTKALYYYYWVAP